MDQGGGAVCASHPSRGSVGTCARCGRFSCEACAAAAPCLECQVLQRQATRHLSPGFDRVIGISSALYALCTVATVPLLAQFDFTRLNAKVLTSAPMLLFLAVETVYSLVATALMVAFLIWYSFLIDWGRSRGSAVPGNGVAFACWFVPFVNFVHPFTTVRTIQRTTSVRAPVGWWWALMWLSLILSVVGSAGIARGGYDPIFTLASALELVAVYLCWRVALAFRLADQAWDPSRALVLRDGPQNVNTSAEPS